MKQKIFFILLCTIVLSVHSLSPVESIKVENTDLGGFATLVITSLTPSTEVWLNNIYKGTCPITIRNLSSGTYTLSAKRSGYKELRTSISLVKDTTTTIVINLEVQTGFLSVKTFPSDADIVVGYKFFKEGIIELPVGLQSVVIQKFGYTSQKESVKIHENSLSSLEVSLEEAPFEMTYCLLTNSLWNPQNSGRNSELELIFHVSAKGYAEISVYKDNNLVFSQNTASFRTWQQTWTWNGVDSSGQTLKDGKYKIKIKAIPDNPNDEICYSESDFTVDSSFIIYPSGKYRALDGSYYVPDPFASQSITSNSATLLGVSLDDGKVSFTSTFNFTKTKENDIGVAISLGNHESLLSNLSLAGKFAIVQDKTFAFSLLADVYYDVNEYGCHINLGPVLGANLASFRLSLLPLIDFAFIPDFVSRCGLALSMSLSNYVVNASLSCKAWSTPFTETFAIASPIMTALELEFLPRNWSATLIMMGACNIYIDNDVEPSLATKWFCGLGVEFELSTFTY